MVSCSVACCPLFVVYSLRVVYEPTVRMRLPVPPISQSVDEAASGAEKPSMSRDSSARYVLSDQMFTLPAVFGVMVSAMA